MKQRTTVKLHSFAALAVVAMGCDGDHKSSFASKSKKLTSAVTYTQQAGDATPQTPTPAPVATPTPKPDINYTEDPVNNDTENIRAAFSVASPLDVTVSGGAVWAVTGSPDGPQVSKVYRIELDETRNYPMQAWTIPFEYGNRTFVSEIGLLIGRTQRGARNRGGIYVAGPSITGGFQPIFAPGDATPWMASESRMCVASFVVGGVPYIGGAYVDAAGHRRFVRIPIDKSKPNGVDTTRKVVWDLGDATNAWWGYSCFMDQRRNFFWSDFHNHAPRYGVNVATGELLQPNAAPNASVVFNNGILRLSPTAREFDPDHRASYAVAGDSQGNILSFSGAYTSAHDSSLDLVYTSRGANIYVAPSSCFSSQPDCTPTNGRFFTWDLSSVSLAFGPMSSLHDGRVVGVTPRGMGPSQVFLMSPKNPANLNEGPILKKIAQLGEPAYMYTDFTGATLYAAHVEKTIVLQDATGFKPNIPISDATLSWQATSGRSEDWVGLAMQLRCFDSASSTRPGWTSFTPAKAGEQKTLPCSGKFNTVELKVDGDGSGAFSRTKQITISGKQNQG